MLLLKMSGIGWTHNHTDRVPRDRERFHPYHREVRDDSRWNKGGTISYRNKGRIGDSDSSSSWRVKGSSPYDKDKDRNREQWTEKKIYETVTRSTRNSLDSQHTVSDLFTETVKGSIRGEEKDSRQEQNQGWCGNQSGLEREKTMTGPAPELRKKQRRSDSAD